MERKTFFKMLLGLLVAPKIIQELGKPDEAKCYFDADKINKQLVFLDNNPKLVKKFKSISISEEEYFRQLQLLTPDWYPKYIDKYGIK